MATQRIFYLNRWELCANRRRPGTLRRTLRSQRTEEWRFLEDDEFQTMKRAVRELSDLPERVKIAGNCSIEVRGERTEKGLLPLQSPLSYRARDDERWWRY